MATFQTKRARKINVIDDLRGRNTLFLRQQLLGFIENQV